VNPVNNKEFTSVSHDKSIKVWDSTRFTVSATLTGHTNGVWGVDYDRKTGKRIITCSTDSTAKIWDIKSGKCSATLAGHTRFVYDAKFNSDATFACTVGSDQKINYWDMRNTETPLFTCTEVKNVLMTCDFLVND
jgi:WD40 repeat protein